MAAWAVRKRGMVQSGSGGGSGTWHEVGRMDATTKAEQWCVQAAIRLVWRHKQQLTFWRSRVARVMPYDSFFLCRSGAWSVVGGCGRTGWIMIESTCSDGLSVSGAHTRRIPRRQAKDNVGDGPLQRPDASGGAPVDLVLLAVLRLGGRGHHAARH